MEQAQPGWRIVVSTAQQQGLPVLAMSSSLGYFDMYRTASLPLNLTQAQRDFSARTRMNGWISQSQVPFILSGRAIGETEGHSVVGCQQEREVTH